MKANPNSRIFVDMHEGLELIHTDLKPENIIFVHEEVLEKSHPPDRPSPVCTLTPALLFKKTIHQYPFRSLIS